MDSPMFFLVSKVLGYLVLPSNFIGLLGLFAIAALLFGYRKTGHTFLVVSVLLLAVFGWSPVGPAALAALEDRFPQPSISGPVTGLIMLGGAVDTHITGDRNSPALNEAGERLTAPAALARLYPEARILLSGGANHLVHDNSPTESQIARDVLLSIGVAAERIKIEELSRNTCENGSASAALFQLAPGEQWLLVTSAAHMPRAIACFRAAGVMVTPYPVDYRTRGDADFRRPVATIAAGLAASDLAMHEWLGLLIYRVLGLTDQLFPAAQAPF
jgi:uncharacterized SAM-binding protein YcdF (DUF218 family)